MEEKEEEEEEEFGFEMQVLCNLSFFEFCLFFSVSEDEKTGE